MPWPPPEPSALPVALPTPTPTIPVRVVNGPSWLDIALAFATLAAVLIAVAAIIWTERQARRARRERVGDQLALETRALLRRVGGFHLTAKGRPFLKKDTDLADELSDLMARTGRFDAYLSYGLLKLGSALWEMRARKQMLEKVNSEPDQKKVHALMGKSTMETVRWSRLINVRLRQIELDVTVAHPKWSKAKRPPAGWPTHPELSAERKPRRIWRWSRAR